MKKTMNVDPSDVQIKIFEHQFRSCDDVINEFTFSENISADIYLKENQVVGKIKAHYFDIDGARDNQISIFELFDNTIDHNQYYYHFFNQQTKDIKESVLKKFNYCFTGNILLIETIEILKPWRKKGIGLPALLCFMRRCSRGCAFIMLKVFPLQFEYRIKNSENMSKWDAAMQYETLLNNNKISVMKLKKYYSLLGFKDCGKNFMMCSTDYEFPALSTII